MVITLLLLAGAGAIGSGVFAIVAPKRAWRWQERQNDYRGLASSHTDRWDAARITWGLMFVALGVIMIVIVMTQVRPYA